MKFYTFQIIIEQEDSPEDGYFAYTPQLPGCYSNGGTIEEVRLNMREAVESHLSSLRENGKIKLDLKPARPIYKEELVIGIPV